MRRTLYRLCSIALLLVYTPPVSAQIGWPVTIHGFGGWAYGRTDNENRYLAGTEDGAYDSLNFSLNLTAKPYDRLSLHVQTAYNESPSGNEVGLDYAFADWSFSDAFSLRVGKVKAPFMLSTEVYDVGTIRPFFFLPQAVYQEFAAEAYKGVGITGSFILKRGWEVIYDLYGGKLSLQSNLIMNRETRQFATIEPLINDMVGGRLTLRTPLDGLALSLSSYSGTAEFKLNGQVVEGYPFEDHYTLVGASAEYLSDRWSLRSEYLTQHESPKSKIDAVYGEAAYNITDHWQVAARYGFIELDLNTPLTEQTPDALLKHEEIVLGVNYWINPSLVLKTSYHIVQGNRFAIPNTEQAYFTNILSGFDQTTNLVAFGVQFSF
jgi:hypothetical protein